MKIAFLTNSFSFTGGVGKYARSCADALMRLGHQPIIVHDDASLDASLPYPCKRFPRFEEYKTPEAERQIEEVMNFLISEKPDLVHVQANMNYPLEEKILKNFPAIKSLHVYDFCPSGTKYHHALHKVCHHATGAMCLPRMLYKRCTTSKRPSTLSLFYNRTMDNIRNDQAYSKVLVASEYVKNQAVESGYPSDQIEVLPYFTAIPEKIISPAETSGPKIIMATGRMVPEKGFAELLTAFSHLKNHTNWKLVMDGDGPDLEPLKKLTRRLQLTDRVEFPGWLDSKSHLELYQKTSLVIMPSVWPEPFGLVGIEAMSYGKPVIAFRVGGIPEWLEDQKTGFLIEPQNLKEMAAKILTLLENSKLSAAMGEAGREKVIQEFDEKLHMNRLINIYQDLIAQFKREALHE